MLNKNNSDNYFLLLRRTYYRMDYLIDSNAFLPTRQEQNEGHNQENILIINQPV